MRKLERARRFDNFFNLLLLVCFCFFPPPKKRHHLAPVWAAAVLKEFLVFVVERRRKNIVRQESRESTFLSLFSTRKKNVESSDNRRNLAHCQLLDLLLDEAVLGRHVGQGPGPQDGVCRKDGGSHPGGDGDVIGDAVAEPERIFVLFFLSSGEEEEARDRTSGARETRARRRSRSGR